MSRVIPADEIKQHNTKESCWMAIDGKVYDVTDFLDDHPGGGDIVVAEAGTDASEAFESVGHSTEAHEMMEKYLIGTLDGYVPKESGSGGGLLSSIYGWFGAKSS